MKIEFRLLDKTTETFRIVYFERWNNKEPSFTSDPQSAKQYWHDRLAEEDINLLQKAKSETAITISIKLVP
ncbi:hypothetical protein [Enterococcus sp. 5H]|uniref:hypothetical protein n=1 Tax=Enterococcus sp. 5H TaxID=1229490 RepID=UPI00230306EA|nr:hypothetical protein [Enterococcus sp. 5H]MDA9472194.1 hypothetical protein [Enterococcus sp. 5H]